MEGSNIIGRLGLKMVAIDKNQFNLHNNKLFKIKILLYSYKIKARVNGGILKNIVSHPTKTINKNLRMLYFFYAQETDFRKIKIAYRGLKEVLMDQKNFFLNIGDNLSFSVKVQNITHSWIGKIK